MNEVRLIDANALKEDLRQYFTDGVLDGVSARLAFNQILHDIDNAPTVCGNNPKWCESCVSKGKCAITRPQGEYKTACNVLLSLEQIVRSSDGWEDSAVEAVHNSVQTAIKALEEVEEWHKLKLICANEGIMVYKVKPDVIDNCDMNVFEPEKYMEGGAE